MKQKTSPPPVKLFNFILLTTGIILTVMSVIAITAVNWNCAREYSFSFTPEGISRYLAAYGSYKSLFTATVSSIAAYLGLLRLKAATDANVDKLKQDRFNEWKTILELRFLEFEERSPLLKREFVKIRYNLFCYLYETDFALNDKNGLLQFLDSNISQQTIRFIEQDNRMYRDMAGTYTNSSHSYSFDAFRFMILGCLSTVYDGIDSDLEAYYLGSLPADREIDPVAYHQLISNRRPR